MRSVLYAVLVAAWALGTPGPARAESAPSALTAEEAVREALVANRDLQAARLAIAAARGRRLQAGRLENPELELAYADDFAFESEGERTASVAFSQSFPVTARLSRERNVAAKDVEIAASEVRNFARELVAEVETVFYRARAWDERLAVNQELIDSVRAVEKATGRRLEAAEVSPAEVGLLRIERLRLEQESVRLRQQAEASRATLARLLGRDAPGSLELVGELDPGTAPTGSPGRIRPDLEAASRGVERAEADRALARSEAWEDWTVAFGYDRERAVFDAPIGVEEDEFLGFGLRIPLPLWNRQQGRIAEAEAELRRARHARGALALRVDEEVRVAQAEFRALRANVDAYADSILPEASRTRELIERGYREGLVGIADLLQAQRQYNETRALYLTLLGDLRAASISLEAATGSSPHLRAAPGARGTP